jgi:competence protein ComEA
MVCPQLIRFLKKGWFFIFSGILLVVFLIVTKDDTLPEQEQALNVFPEDSNTDAEPAAAEAQPGKAVIDVKGEIVKPGVYEMDAEARVNDVIELAGGFTKEADQTFVNLAAKVQDEMVIHVPGKGDSGEIGGSAAEENGKVKVNYAEQEELETLSGIGPSKAEAIISYREEHGFFQTPEDLLQVSGIGEKTLEAFYDELQIP